MGPLEFYIIRQTLLTVERVDKLKNVEWYKPVYICAFAGYAKITSSAQKVYTDMLFLALIHGQGTRRTQETPQGRRVPEEDLESFDRVIIMAKREARGFDVSMRPCGE